MVIYSCAVLVTVMPECYVKRIVCKTWTGTLEYSTHSDQMLQNSVSDQTLHFLLKLQGVKG